MDLVDLYDDKRSYQRMKMELYNCTYSCKIDPCREVCPSQQQEEMCACSETNQDKCFSFYTRLKLGLITGNVHCVYLQNVCITFLEKILQFVIKYLHMIDNSIFKFL